MRLVGDGPSAAITKGMGAIDNFLRRFGYAKLDRYGLMLTGDDRVLSTRPAVLDDGLGGKIVGWTDDDLAAMELEHIGVPKKKAATPIAAPASLHQLPKAPPPMPVAAKVIAPAAPIAPVAKAAPKLPGMPPAVVAPVVKAAAPVVVAPPQVAAEPELTEDEWEWEIAMARARAVAEEVQQAAASIASAATAPRAPVKRKTSPGLPAVRAKTEPPVRSLPTPVAPLSAKEPAPLPPAPTPQRKTVIPVPAMPQAARPSDVRPLGYQPTSQPPRRLPRGTGPVGEDTVQTLAAPVANDDRPSPYMTMPSEVKPVGYAHTKRVAAKQR